MKLPFLFSAYLLLLNTAFVNSKTHTKQSFQSDPPPAQCLTKECIITAAAVLDNVDDSISPCSNFYDFVCKRYMETTPLIDDSEKTLFVTRYEEYLAELNVALSKPKRTEEPEAFQNAKDVYLTCMTDNAKNQVQSLMEFLDSLGGWPLLHGDQWNETDFDWLSLTHRIIKLGLLDAAVLAPVQNSGDDQPKFSLEINLQVNKLLMKLREFHHNDHPLNFFEELLQQTGLQRNITKDVHHIYNFAKTVDEILEHRNDEVTVMSCVGLEGSLPTIDWRQFLEHVYVREASTHDNVWIQSFGIFKELIVLMETTDKRVLANWYLANMVINMFTEEFFPPEITNIIKATDSEDTFHTSRVRYCLHFVYRLFPNTVRGMHTKRFFTPQDKLEVKQLEAYIRVELRNLIKKGYIFPPELINKTATLLKPENVLDGIDISEEYFRENFAPSELGNTTDIDRQKHFPNALILGDHEYKHQMNAIREGKNLNQETEQLSLLFDYPTFLIDWASNKSALYTPASLLRGLFFSANRPKYLNYGMLGFTLAQEMFRKLESTDNQFLEAVKSHRHCLQHQYINSIFDDNEEPKSKAPLRKIINTIADDLWGIYIANMAYKEAALWSGPEPYLPGMNYTTKQMFWISYAMTLCQAYDEEEMANDDVTVLGRTRVLHLIPNSDEFAKDFNCPKNSAMNPEEKCHLPL